MQKWKAACIAAGFLTPVMGVAGCGHTTPAPTARSLVLQARSAALSARGVDMVYTANDGQNQIGIDESFAENGGTLSTTYENGMQVSSLLGGGTVYFKINPSVLAMYGQPASLCGTDCGKYIEAPTSRQQQLQSQMTISYGVSRMISQIPTGATNYRGLKIQKATVSTVPSLCVSGKKLPIPAQICVTASGRPQFTEITWKQGSTIQVVFSHWNSVPPILAPPPSEVLTEF